MHYDRDSTPRRSEAILEAIRLDPYDADYHGLRAAIHGRSGSLGGRPRSAEGGLEIDPEHVSCNNLRAMALVRLNRRTRLDRRLLRLSPATRKSPSRRQSGMGPAAPGRPCAAFDHFREALRLDPELQWARQGIVEAMKARNPLYRPILGFFLWISRLSDKAQWAVFIATVPGSEDLRSLGRANPARSRCPPAGRLDRAVRGDHLGGGSAVQPGAPPRSIRPTGPVGEQVIASNWIGVCVALCVSSA